MSFTIRDDVVKSMTKSPDNCAKFYKVFKGYLAEEGICNIILKNLDKEELDNFIQSKKFGYTDTDTYYKLQEATGNRIDEIFEKRYPHIVAARNLYKSRYRVEVE